MPRARKAPRFVWRVREKDVEQTGDRLMAVLGFMAWHLSQPRKTMQTPGWPDRLYTNRARRLAVYWEAKRPGGKQRASQRTFQEEIEACGGHYVCGTSDALLAWCERQGLVEVMPGGGLLVRR